jgi:hypothetical protein
MIWRMYMYVTVSYINGQYEGTTSMHYSLSDKQSVNQILCANCAGRERERHTAGERKHLCAVTGTLRSVHPLTSLWRSSITHSSYGFARSVFTSPMWPLCCTAALFKRSDDFHSHNSTVRPRPQSANELRRCVSCFLFQGPGFKSRPGGRTYWHFFLFHSVAPHRPSTDNKGNLSLALQSSWQLFSILRNNNVNFRVRNSLRTHTTFFRAVLILQGVPRKTGPTH